MTRDHPRPNGRDEPEASATRSEGSPAMRPLTASNRRPSRSLRVTALVVLLVAAACESSVVPSASPSSPRFVADRDALRRPLPLADRSGRLAGVEPPGRALARRWRRRLRPGCSGAHRVRPAARAFEAPRRDASIKYEPVLPVGTELQVIEGPVEGSGYQWVRVAPVDVTLDGGVSDGWVAIADHDGTPWVAVSDAPLAGLAVAQSSVDRVPVSVADAKRTAADINAFGLALYRRLVGDPKAKSRRQGRRHVADQHRHGPRDGSRRRHRHDRDRRWTTSCVPAGGVTSAAAWARSSRSSTGTTRHGRTARARRMPSR